MNINYDNSIIERSNRLNEIIAKKPMNKRLAIIYAFLGEEYLADEETQLLAYECKALIKEGASFPVELTPSQWTLPKETKSHKTRRAIR